MWTLKLIANLFKGPFKKEAVEFHSASFYESDRKYFLPIMISIIKL